MGRGRQRVLWLNISKSLTKTLLVEILRMLQVSSVALGQSHPDQKSVLESQWCSHLTEHLFWGDQKDFYERVLGDSPT